MHAPSERVLCMPRGMRLFVGTVLLVDTSWLQPVLGQQASAPAPRDDPDYRTKAVGSCDSGTMDSLLSFATETASGECDPTKSCCSDWLEENGAPGAGSTAKCVEDGTSAEACEESLGCNWRTVAGGGFLGFGGSETGSCVPDLTQTCCSCADVSLDGKCGTWTSVCFMCASTVAEDFCPEACAFDLLKWRTGIEVADKPVLQVPPGCADPGMDPSSYVGCVEVALFQLVIVVVLVYIIVGCSVAPPLFWPCKFLKCCCKCIPGASTICDENYSSPDSESSDDEETRRKRAERRNAGKKKKKKKSSGAREKEVADGVGVGVVGGGGGGAPAAGGGDRYKVLEKAMVKEDYELQSEIVGSLSEGQIIRGLETRTNSEGIERVRCSKGWISIVARDGSPLLEVLEDVSANGAAAGAAVDQMRGSMAAAGGGGTMRQRAPTQTQSDWVERFSDQHNRKYWVNSKTGQSSWTDPNVGAPAPAPAPAPAAAQRQRATQTQSDWVERFSDQHNRKFWVNSKTGQSSWIDPNAAERTANPVSQGGAEREM